MSDMIKIEQLSAYCLIGIFDWERQVKQKVLIDIVLFSDIKNATQNDDIKYTANYKKITQAVLKEVENSEFYLIETLAEHLTSVILKYDNVNKVKITVSKPGAVKFTENVSVEIVRPSDFTIFYISLGSNIEPSRYLQAAIELLSERFTVEACSSQYRSEAWGTTQKQDDYLNMAAKLSSNKDLFSCRAELRWIEQLLARERLIDKFAPRTIDIDILIYNNQLLPDSDTSLGHPVLSHPFIYLPLKEIAPDLIVPNVGTELKDTKPQYIPPIIKCEQVLI